MNFLYCSCSFQTRSFRSCSAFACSAAFGACFFLHEILNQIADYFNVTVGYLFNGDMAVSQNEKEMLKVFNQFTDREQIKIIGKLEEWFAEKQRRAIAAQKKTNIQTAYVAARSSDKHPPKTVTGNFSDIENTLDVTDEY